VGVPKGITFHEHATPLPLIPFGQPRDTVWATETPSERNSPDTVWATQGYKSRPTKKHSEKTEKNKDFRNSIVVCKISTMNNL